MWCWPQPFGQPLILMLQVPAPRPPGRAARRRWSPSRRPRPRDWVTASRQASAPGQLVTSASVSARRRGPSPAAASRSYSAGTSGVPHPAEEQVLVVGRAHRAVAVGRGEVAPARAAARRSGRRGARVTVDERRSPPASAGARSCAPSGRSRRSSTGSAGTDGGREAGPADLGRGRARRHLAAPGARAGGPAAAPLRRAAPRDRRAARRRPRPRTSASAALELGPPASPSPAPGSGTSCGCAACACSRRGGGRPAARPRPRRGSRPRAGTRRAPGPSVAQDRRCRPPTVTRKPRARPFRPRRARGQPRSLMARERVVLGAALEGDLELARQRRAQRMAQQVARERLGVGRHVEHLVARPRPRTGRR